jgi:hypothetical protein
VSDLLPGAQGLQKAWRPVEARPPLPPPPPCIPVPRLQERLWRAQSVQAPSGEDTRLRWARRTARHPTTDRPRGSPPGSTEPNAATSAIRRASHSHIADGSGRPRGCSPQPGAPITRCADYHAGRLQRCPPGLQQPGAATTYTRRTQHRAVSRLGAAQVGHSYSPQPGVRTTHAGRHQRAAGRPGRLLECPSSPTTPPGTAANSTHYRAGHPQGCPPGPPQPGAATATVSTRRANQHHAVGRSGSLQGGPPCSSQPGEWIARTCRAGYHQWSAFRPGRPRGCPPSPTQPGTTASSVQRHVAHLQGCPPGLPRPGAATATVSTRRINQHHAVSRSGNLQGGPLWSSQPGDWIIRTCRASHHQRAAGRPGRLLECPSSPTPPPGTAANSTHYRAEHPQGCPLGPP